MSADHLGYPVLTKREFLQGFAAVVGVSVTRVAMNARAYETAKARSGRGF